MENILRMEKIIYQYVLPIAVAILGIWFTIHALNGLRKGEMRIWSRSYGIVKCNESPTLFWFSFILYLVLGLFSVGIFVMYLLFR